MTRTTSRNQVVEFTVSDDCNFPVHVTLDGKGQGKGCLGSLKSPAGNITHGVNIWRETYGMTADEAAMLQAEIDAVYPTVVDTLVEARLARSGLVNALDDARYAIANDQTGNPAKAYRAETAAKQALADYDAAHPEALAEVNAQRAAAQAQRKADYEQSFIGRGLD